MPRMMPRNDLSRKPAALIVAHGQPSDPAPAGAEIAFLAAKVQSLMPDWHVRAATLAEPGAIARAVAEAGEEGLVYPLFMAGGWFTRTHLPEKLAEAGGARWTVLPPFGLDGAVQALAVDVVREALLADGLVAREATVLVAAHGSFRSPAPAEVARDVATRLQGELGLARVEVGFIDQSPRIAEVAAGLPADAIVLPFFAARGGHVIDDLPAALEEAGFLGRVLPPLGLDARVPGLVRRALKASRG